VADSPLVGAKLGEDLRRQRPPGLGAERWREVGQAALGSCGPAFRDEASHDVVSRRNGYQERDRSTSIRDLKGLARADPAKYGARVLLELSNSHAVHVLQGSTFAEAGGTINSIHRMCTVERFEFAQPRWAALARSVAKTSSAAATALPGLTG
jgi:hypothetical protein